MRNKIVGGIGVAWGGLILLNWFMSEKYIDEAYQLGHNTGAIFGVLLLAAGLYYFFKKPK